jgi:signal transduction histidine kinase
LSPSLPVVSASAVADIWLVRGEANEWAARLPWALMLVEPTGALFANARLLELLHSEAASPASLVERFEICRLGGRALDDEDLPWRRAARGETFSEEETWYDRRSAERMILQLRCQPAEGAALLSFESLSDHPLLLRRSELAASVAVSLLRAQDAAGVAHAIVGDVSSAVNADALLLLESDPREQRLHLLGARGLPAAVLDDYRTVSLEVPSLLALVARTQTTQEIDHIEALSEKDFAGTRQLLQVGLRSTVVLPLLVDGELVGVLELAWRHPGKPNRLERRTLEAVRAACALGIHYARLRASERRETERLRTLRDAALAVEDALPLRDLLRRLVDQACELTRSRYGALGVLDPDGGRLADFIFSGVSPGLVDKIGHLPDGRGLLGAVIRERQPIRVADIQTDPRATGFPAHHPPMTSFLGVPLRIGREVFGNFYLCDKDGGAEFTDDDERLLELFAAQSALAVGYARQMQMAEQAHRELARVHDELSAVIAHDLRSPVSTILLQVEALAAQTGDRISVSRPILERLRRCAQRVSQMTNDLLDVSRIELERLTLDRQPLAPVAALESLLAQMSPLLTDHPVSLEVQGTSPPIWADPGRFEQVLTNLIENAAKYSGPGAPIRIVVDNADGGALITVEDHGAGIAPEDLPRLFDRFYQAARARAQKSGLGLGLYIAKGLVEAHGGRIWVESQLGQGSRFHLWLPCGDDMSASARAP